MEKTIEIDGKEVRFKATGATIRLYRQMFQRDILADMEHVRTATSGDSPMSADALNMFENMAYIMAKQADPTIPDTADEWLDGFDMFSIYKILPQVVELWGISNATLSNSKKKVTAKRADH